MTSIYQLDLKMWYLHTLNFLGQGFQKLECNRQTDTQADRCTVVTVSVKYQLKYGYDTL